MNSSAGSTGRRSVVFVVGALTLAALWLPPLPFALNASDFPSFLIRWGLFNSNDRWSLRWDYFILPPLLIWALIVAWKSRVSVADAGLTFRHFSGACRLLALPTLIGAFILFAIGGLYHSTEITPRFWKRLLPLNGFVQQLAIQLFFHRQLMPWFGTGRKTAAILAIYFAVLHLPNPGLTTGTLFGMYFWARTYQKEPNLYALALSHAFLSATLMHTLPKAFLPSVSVGWRFIEKGIAHHWWNWFS